MNPRLDELLRQRALLAQHLAWLDQEIIQAKAEGAPEAETREPPGPVFKRFQPQQPEPPVMAEPPVMEPSAAGAEDAIAEDIISRYSEPRGQSAASAKRSAYLAFALFMVFMAALVAAFYFYEKSRLGR